MKTKNYLPTVLVSLSLCIVLINPVFASVESSPIKNTTTQAFSSELIAIDVPLDAGPMLDQLGIIYQDQPRFGFWRAAVTPDQLDQLKKLGIGYRINDQVAIVRGGKSMEGQTNAAVTNLCNAYNPADLNIPIAPNWLYDAIDTNCPGATTVDYLDIYYDVIHPWADNALYLNLGSNSPSWDYINLEVPSGVCGPPWSPDWHKYQYNITYFNGRPVNQQWDLVLSDNCPDGPRGYIDYWTIWVYYTSTAPAPVVRPTYLGPEFTIAGQPENEYTPQIAYNSIHHEYLVVYEIYLSDGYYDIYAQRISESGSLLGSFAVSTGPFSSMQPSVAYDPASDRYLVTWSYDYWGNNGDYDIRGRFVPWNGPDPALPEFTICDWNSIQNHIKVVFATSAPARYMVVWENTDPYHIAPDYISGRIVYPNGSMGDAFTISTGTEPRGYPDVAYNIYRDQFIIVWNMIMAGGNYDIYGQRIAWNGTPVGNEFVIAGWPSLEVHPSIAACSGADQYMVAWQSDDGSGWAESRIYSRYMNGDGILSGVYQIENVSSYQENIDVSCNSLGSKYILVWDHLYGVDEYGIWARLALPDGSMSQAFEVIPPSPGEQLKSPVIDASDSSYLVSWENEINNSVDIHGRFLRYPGFFPVAIK